MNAQGAENWATVDGAYTVEYAGYSISATKHFGPCEECGWKIECHPFSDNPIRDFWVVGATFQNIAPIIDDSVGAIAPYALLGPANVSDAERNAVLGAIKLFESRG